MVEILSGVRIHGFGRRIQNGNHCNRQKGQIVIPPRCGASSGIKEGRVFRIEVNETEREITLNRLHGSIFTACAASIEAGVC